MTLTDPQIVAGIGAAVEAGDKGWLTNIILNSPYAADIPSDVLGEFVDMVMGKIEVDYEAEGLGWAAVGSQASSA